MEKEKLIKNKSALLLAMFILFAVFQVAGIILFSIGAKYTDLVWIVESVIVIVESFLIYFSYRTHTKNVMKPLLGAILMLLLLDSVNTAFSSIQDFTYGLSFYISNSALMVRIIMNIAIFVVMAAINVMHYVINTTHHSSPLKIKLNKLFYIFYVALVFAMSVCELCVTTVAIAPVGIALSLLADVFLINMVIIIESSLDEFRLERELNAEQ